jgi:hypothetical protein
MEPLFDWLFPRHRQLWNALLDDGERIRRQWYLFLCCCCNSTHDRHTGLLLIKSMLLDYVVWLKERKHGLFNLQPKPEAQTMNNHNRNDGY